MTYTVKVEKKIRLSKMSNWQMPYDVTTFELDENIIKIERFIQMHIQNGYVKNIGNKGETRLYKQVANNECETLIITENK